MKKSQERRQVNFRPTPNLKKRLDAAAKENGVALNAEIVRRLEQSFEDEGIDAVINMTSLRMSIDFDTQLRQTLNEVVDDLRKKLETSMLGYVDARLAAERTIKEASNV